MTPNLPSLYETATWRSPSFASRRGVRLKSSAAPQSIHSVSFMAAMICTALTSRDAPVGERFRTRHDEPRHPAVAALPAAALHQLLAGSLQRRLCQAANECRSG